ncbi:MAG: ABC transporter ATP-binding protein [Acidimicrobiales bacterium]
MRAVGAGGSPQLPSGVAVAARGISKRFRLQKDRPSSLKEGLLNLRRTTYDEFWALNDVDLDIRRGAAFGIIGHNGSGKSTLLRLIAGIHRPTTGTIAVGGRVSALLELGAGFHPDLTGRENVFLNASILGIPPTEIREKLDEIVSFARLDDFIDSPVKIYSNGMLVRLGFSVAIHVEPDVLLLDEVITVGDEEFQRACLEEILRFRERGVTIVVVSHDLGTVRRFCDDAAWLDHGRVVTTGTSGDVVDRYLTDVDAHTSSDAADVGATVRVADVEFIDGSGRSTIAAATGEALTLRGHLDVQPGVEGLRFRMLFHGPGGVNFAEPVVTLDAARTRGGGRIQVDYVIDRFPFRPGSYPLTVFAESPDGSVVHHRLERVFTLQVLAGADPDMPGWVDLGGRWEDTPPQR